MEWPEGHSQEKQVHKTISRVSHNLCLLTYFDAPFHPSAPLTFSEIIRNEGYDEKEPKKDRNIYTGAAFDD